VKAQLIAYWVATAIVAFSAGSGGIAELAGARPNIDGLVHLGYPVYFAPIIGFWKLFGAIAVLVPRFPRLKEWAYAGIFFNMSGAAASHLITHDEAWHVVVTSVLALLAMASWALRPQSRTLGCLSFGTKM
jgi:uncharacterized membrane protein YphA (DoxX/SURF4 family)